MIRSRLLSVLVLAIGAVLFAFAVSYALEACEDAQLYFRANRGGGDAEMAAVWNGCVSTLLLSLALWCVRGGVLNVRAFKRPT
jgi:hypothetical protein